MKEIEAIKTLVDKELITKEEGYDLIVKLFEKTEIPSIEEPKRKYKKGKKSKQSKGKKKYTTWTPEMDKKIRELYPEGDTKDLADSLEVTEKQIKQRAYLIGVKKNKKKTPGPKPSSKRSFWNKEDTDYLKEHYPKEITLDIAKHLKRPLKKVMKKAEHLGLKKILNEKIKEKKPDKVRKWSDNDDKFIMDNYNFLAEDEIAQQLDREVSSVKTRIYDLKQMGKISLKTD